MEFVSEIWATGVDFGQVPAAKFTVNTLVAGPENIPLVCSVQALSA